MAYIKFAGEEKKFSFSIWSFGYMFTAWLYGIWFDLDLVGGFFKDIAYLLPFVHAVELQRAVYSGVLSDIFPYLWWVLGYTAASLIGAVLLFLRQIKKN